MLERFAELWYTMLPCMVAVVSGSVITTDCCILCVDLWCQSRKLNITIIMDMTINITITENIVEHWSTNIVVSMPSVTLF